MLLKKILYGYSRVRYVICQQEENGKVLFEFCRWIPLGSRNGKLQYFSRIYVREPNDDRYKSTRVSQNILQKLNKITSKRYVRFGYFGDWCVTFYSTEIKEVMFGWLLRNWWAWFLLLYIFIKYYIK